jgi:hypothetical protein
MINIPFAPLVFFLLSIEYARSIAQRSVLSLQVDPSQDGTPPGEYIVLGSQQSTHFGDCRCLTGHICSLSCKSTTIPPLQPTVPPEAGTDIPPDFDSN